jgi:hypothetical protein
VFQDDDRGTIVAIGDRGKPAAKSDNVANIVVSPGID